MCRLTGKVPQELAEAPELPASAVTEWRWYIDLASARRSSGFGASSLAWTDIEAYFRLRRIVPEPWEIEAIQALDATFLRVQQERHAASKVGKAPVSGR